MELAETVRLAKESLASNRVRAFLTMLGVIIGVAAVILLVSIGEGARRYIRTALGDLGTNLMVVVPGKTSKEGGMHMGTSAVRKLTMDDAVLLEKRTRSILDAEPVMLGTSWIKYGENSRDTYIVGITSDYFGIRNLEIALGRKFTDSEVESARRVCVLGRTVKRDIFGDRNPLGEKVTIGNSSYRVVGIMAPKGVTLGNDFDDLVLVPVTSAIELFDIDALFNITVKVPGPEYIDDAKEEITDILARRHAGREDFTILSQDEMLDVMGRILNIMTAVLAGIAAISLVVGGIGIMNIMLVSVRERTREIGIRKALGARKRDILMQFLVEAVTLSLTGGVIGIATGAGMSFAISYFVDFLPTRVTWWVVALAFLFSVNVGIFFGVYPARKAAHYDPIVALRYE